MKTKFLALATVATMALGAPAFAQQDGGIDMGYNMLTGAIYNALVSRDLPTDGISELSLTQIATIKSILSSGDSDTQIEQRIKDIMEAER